MYKRCKAAPAAAIRASVRLFSSGRNTSAPAENPEGPRPGQSPAHESVQRARVSMDQSWSTDLLPVTATDGMQDLSGLQLELGLASSRLNALLDRRS